MCGSARGSRSVRGYTRTPESGQRTAPTSSTPLPGGRPDSADSADSADQEDLASLDTRNGGSLRRRPSPASRSEASPAIEERYGKDNIGPWDDRGWGFVNGKPSALSWVLGGEWDFLDT
jgi:hypothetical protein